MKRKLFRALEQIKHINFSARRKGSASDSIEWGFRLDSHEGETISLPKARKLDPYTQFSRKEMLRDIVKKLKAKK